MRKVGKLIFFKVSKNNPKSKIDKFCRQFNGYVDRSNNNRYQYHRKGFIEDFPHIKLTRGVIIVRDCDSDAILSFLESYNAEIFVRDIILEDDELV